MSQTSPTYVIRLSQLLSDKFNQEDLIDLCFRLAISAKEKSIDYENIAGDTKLAKCLELVRYCDRRGLIPNLVEVCKELRPRISWDEADELPSGVSTVGEQTSAVPTATNAIQQLGTSDALAVTSASSPNITMPLGGHEPDPRAMSGDNSAEGRGNQRGSSPDTAQLPSGIPTRRAYIVGTVMLVLVVSSVIMAVLLAWRLFGNQPNLLAYIQAAAGCVAVLVQVIALFVAVRPQVTISAVFTALSNKLRLQIFISVLTVILITGTVWSFSVSSSPQAPSVVPLSQPTVSYTLTPLPTATHVGTASPTTKVAITASLVIISPVEGQNVPRLTAVRGTISAVPPDNRLWMLVQSYMEPSYYPDEVVVQPDGDWEVTAHIGLNKPSEWNRPFTITVVLADASASRHFDGFDEQKIRPEDALLPSGAVVVGQIHVIRNNPLVTLDSHKPSSEVDSPETLEGEYHNLETGDWRLYSIISIDDRSFTPSGPFEPKTTDGRWSMTVNIPWPSDGTRNVRFTAWAVISGTHADSRLLSASQDGSTLNRVDLTSQDWEDIYTPLGEIPLIRAEKIAFASDLPGNDDVFVIKADGTNLRRLTTGPAWDGDAAWSPDGQHIVFTSNRTGRYELFLMDSDGMNQRRLISDRIIDAGTPKWSPDGAWIVFQSWYEGDNHIYKVRTDGTDLTRLTNVPGWDGFPSWSPDGKRILFSSRRVKDDGGTTELYVMNADGTDIQRLTHNQTDDGPGVWTPDGQSIIYIGYAGGKRGVDRMKSDGSDVTALANIDYDRGPTVAPDGQRIAFSSSVDRGQLFLIPPAGEPSRINTGLAISVWPTWSPVAGSEDIAFSGRFDGDWELYTMWDNGLDSRADPIRLTNNDFNDVQSHIAADRRHIVYSSNASGNYDIWVIDTKSPTNPVRLTNGQSDNEYPRWSPDGRKIAFASDRGGNWDIYVMNADGTGVVQLTDHPDADDRPFWSPDGTQIIYCSDRSGHGDIYITDASTGKNVTRVVDHPEFDWTPAWSGQVIVFSSTRDHPGTWHTELYALNLISHELTRLTDSSEGHSNPLWSSDGRHIFYTSGEDIWVMSADGKNQQNLTENGRSNIFGP